MPAIANGLLYAGVTSVIPLSSFTGYTAAKVAVATRARISAIGNGCVVTYDGTDATITKGHPIAANAAPLVIEGQTNVSNIKVVSLTGTSNVTITLETD